MTCVILYCINNENALVAAVLYCSVLCSTVMLYHWISCFICSPVHSCTIMPCPKVYLPILYLYSNITKKAVLFIILPHTFRWITILSCTALLRYVMKKLKSLLYSLVNYNTVLYCNLLYCTYTEATVVAVVLNSSLQYWPALYRTVHLRCCT